MERDAFLDHLANRLGRPRLTQQPAREDAGPPASYVANPFGTADVPGAGWPEKFADELVALGGEAILVSSAHEASAALRSIADSYAARAEAIITWDRSEFDGWDIDWLWDQAGAAAFTAAPEAPPSEISALREAAMSAALGVTTINYAIVNTGTLLLLTSPTRPRSVSLLPRRHIALVRQSQMVARMGDALPAFDAWRAQQPPSSIHFISGPSRSADIENDLTIGVHGPAMVTAIIWRDGGRLL